MLKMKRIVGMVVMAALWLGMMGAGSCGKKAMVQIDKAKVAVSEARKANADVHAPKRFQSAETKLGDAIKHYEKYKFRFAEESALEAEKQAREALELALATRANLEEQKRKAEELARLQNNSSLSDENLEFTVGANDDNQDLKDVNFDLDSDQLGSAAKSVLDQNAAWLLAHPTVKVEVEGHCDDRGTDEYNQALGARRAKVVQDYLIAKGVTADRLKTISYGEAIPVDQTGTELAWSKNRRAHFAVKN